MPEVSICIPTYNNIEFVRRLLDSIAIQTYSDYEIIISDDSSNNLIEKLIIEYESLVISYYKNYEPLGATANCNRAVEKAKGKYIKMMHHDDWFSNNNSLGTFVELITKEPDIIIAFSGTHQVSSKKQFSRHISDDNLLIISEDYHNLYFGNVIGAPSATIYRRVNIEFDEKLKWLVDLEFYLSLLERKDKFAFTKEPLICIGVSEEQLTESCINNNQLIAFEYGYVYRKHKLDNSKEYYRKLLEILIDCRCSYKEISKYKISLLEYIQKFIRMKIRDRRNQ